MHKQLTLTMNCSLGRFALSPGGEDSFLVYTTDIYQGKITLYNLNTYTQEMEVLAHDSPVIQFAFNEKGTMLATVSCKVFFVIF